MGIFIAAYIVNAARAVAAAVVMLVIAIALWFAIGVLTAVAGVQTGPVVLTSMVVIALAAISVGSFISVRYITRNAVIHPVIAAVSLGILFVSLTMHGDVGPYRVLVLVGAGVVAAISAFFSRSSKVPPNKSVERTRDR